ncbi:hypothetical protein [Streptomyces sp. NPDC059009]|uniref:hypothetical protein n=1 Tax=Streptomyces sp. NPDC059009 TaxID=3346694 RepID=UPI0036A651D9
MSDQEQERAQELELDLGLELEQDQEQGERPALLGVEMRRVSLDDGSQVTIVCDVGLPEAEARSRAARVAEENRR